MKNILFTLFLISFINSIIHGQVKRGLLYNRSVIEFLAQNNRIENDFSFPGMKAFIIIGDSSKSLNQIYIDDKIRKQPVSGMSDYACFYYLKNCYLFKDTAIKFFLTGFIEQCYQTDYINRNSVHLIWQTNAYNIQKDSLPTLNSIVSSISVLNDSSTQNDNSNHITTLIEIYEKSKKTSTTIKYHIPGLLEMEDSENSKKYNKMLAEMGNKEGHLSFQFSVGRYNINSMDIVNLDTNTLVDFSKHKTLWNINTSYYFTHRFYANIDLAFIYSGKKQNIDGIQFNTGGGGITVSGSGSSGAMIRYGVGIGWLPYSRNRFDILFNISAGHLIAIAGGGNGTRTIGGGSYNNTNIVKKKEKTVYYNLLTGFNYRLKNSFFLTGNLQYNLSKLKQPVGSVNSFTGWSINIGFGFSFPTIKKNID